MASSVISVVRKVSALVANHAACSCQSPPFSSQLFGMFRAIPPLMCCRRLVRSTRTAIAGGSRSSVLVILLRRRCSNRSRPASSAPEDREARQGFEESGLNAVAVGYATLLSMRHLSRLLSIAESYRYPGRWDRRTRRAVYISVHNSRFDCSGLF